MTPPFIAAIDSVAYAVAVFTAGHLALQSAAQLLAKPLNGNRLVAAGMFFCLSAIIISLGVGYQKFPDAALWLYGLHVPTYFLLPPLFVAYFKAVMASQSDQFTLRFPGYVWLAPFGVALALHMPTFVMQPDFKRALIAGEIAEPLYQNYRLLLIGVGFVAIGAAIYTLVRVLHRLYALGFFERGSANAAPRLWHFRALLIWLVCVALLGLGAQLLHSASFKRLLIALLSASFLWLYLLDRRYPGFYRSIDAEIRTRTGRYLKSRIQHLDANVTLDRLDQLMVDEQLYADEDLTLEQLAARINIQSAQLSELLNSVRGVEFRHYVTRYRVEAAQRMLRDEAGRTILSVAYAVGFNSKASFNRNFKAVACCTPAQYRRSQSIS